MRSLTAVGTAFRTRSVESSLILVVNACECQSEVPSGVATVQGITECMPADVPESVEDVTAGHVLRRLVQAPEQHPSICSPLDFEARITSRGVADATPLGAAQRCAHVVGQSAHWRVVSMLCWQQHSWAELL